MLSSGSPRAGSSGNMLADKRYAYAEALLAEGDHRAAADLYAQALEEAPGWAAAHLGRGLALERLGDAEGAAESFAAATHHDRSGVLGASLHFERLNGTVPSGMSEAYVAALFDQYAPRFDTHLVESLRYRGPEVILGALGRVAPDFCCGAALDLGCGTGLMARALQGRGLILDGIDLSPAMLAQAEATELYRHLWRGDCEAIARTLPQQQYGLVIAADVLVYLGDLGPLFHAVAGRLAPEGLFAATVQTEAGMKDGYSLGPDLRFRHGADYLRGRLGAAGLMPVLIESCATRLEGGLEVPGLVFVARRP